MSYLKVTFNEFCYSRIHIFFISVFQLITPNGTIVYVNNISYTDIFFGLRGGLNNFGIVTRFSMRAIPQTLVYGGVLVYNSAQIKIEWHRLSPIFK